MPIIPPPGHALGVWHGDPPPPPPETPPPSDDGVDIEMTPVDVPYGKAPTVASGDLGAPSGVFLNNVF